MKLLGLTEGRKTDMTKKMALSLGAVVLTASVYFINPLQANNLFPSQREFKIVYKASLDEFPANADDIKIWMPLASSRDGQIILERKIQTSEPYQITRDPVHGNEMAYFELKQPFPESLDLEVIYETAIARNRFEEENSVKNSNQYLAPSTLMVVNDTVRERTSEAVSGKETWMEKARGIYENVIGSMKYDKTVPGWGRGDTIRACLLGTGNCTDFHSLFISMAHAAEIPARFKIGLTVPANEQGTITGYHCWAEFFAEGKGWQPVDASEAWKHPERKEAYFGNFDTNKFLISVGRDINLAPKQAGPPVNFFFYPYVEVDGNEWNGVKTAFEFKNLRNNKMSLRGAK
ncbi:MAG: hypothetical protein COV74_05970 [Candidatus Omnitrophica bacterium CG11_big_fil_rev_8_21_14_0_20_45_26]|uniref:Transglutaminase-like domain-containing protein n=1 Tax=Candidatus Abzuiibacterium crystallinum TaxID=1974748 RepID=A0A2H0LRJ6_9BACT|nr:MAG: hypothetical protein COV74_05970 [Candidatus Omnitrophica bacterium CG11_big_fil_rev_8_21_14_0_20_45_26]PIW65298.1 MAG: hypothetical protein COW12_02475 [Candidatus Omnitrophica bacterium CG12_big_fil_rev_8_21_14_0_65_45_16]